MKKSVCLLVLIFTGLTAIAFGADLVIGTKAYKFEYEVVESVERETFVVQKNKKQYLNPLVVGFKINKDGSIDPVDQQSARAMKKEPAVIAKTHPAPKTTPGFDKPFYNNDWLIITKEDGGLWASLNSAAEMPETPSERAGESDFDQGVPFAESDIKYNKIEKITILFENDSSQINPKDAKRLTSLPTIYPNAEFNVTGFTCSLGSFARNQKLSRDRARAVARKIIAAGGRVTAESARPMCCYLSETELWKNRRAEITITITANN